MKVKLLEDHSVIVNDSMQVPTVERDTIDCEIGRDCLSVIWPIT